MSDSTRGRIVFLDYMRVFAFISVLVGHKLMDTLILTLNDATVHITIRAIAEGLIPLCQGGAAGVVVFFLTSGYIITHVLQKEPAAEFLIKRIFRIYPLFVTAILLEVLFLHYVHGGEIPPLGILIKRALLIGDFYDMAPALGGVEWTLRIEMMFYLFMFVMKSTRLSSIPKLLPPIFVLAVYALYKSPAFPSREGFTFGYLNAYAPYLFIGSLFYLAERRLASRVICTLASGAMFYMSMSSITSSNPIWGTSHYAAYALLIFLTALFFRAHLQDSKPLRLMSDLTYSVYLFHNWIWGYLLMMFKAFGLPERWEKTAVILTLFIFCYVMHKTIETWGIKLARPVIEQVRRIDISALLRQYRTTTTR